VADIWVEVTVVGVPEIDVVLTMSEVDSETEVEIDTETEVTVWVTGKLKVVAEICVEVTVVGVPEIEVVVVKVDVAKETDVEVDTETEVTVCVGPEIVTRELRVVAEICVEVTVVGVPEIEVVLVTTEVAKETDVEVDTETEVIV
jgi:hypothetical protein